MKVLDFGLARTFGSGGANDGSQEMTLAATREGVILGTPGYMSPEQARGQTVDKRTDIWAFGCVLYELLAGRPPFTGATVSDTIAAVLDREPDWTTLPPLTPPQRRLLLGCLEKDREKRVGDIAVARFVLKEDSSIRPMLEAVPRRSARALTTGLVASAVAVLGVAMLAVLSMRPAAPNPPEMRVDIVTPGASDPLSMALSPDGTRLVFAASDRGGQRLWLRPLDKTNAEPLGGTEGASFPFWSPDGRSLGFFADGKLKRLDLDRGVPRVIADAAPRGGTWNSDGIIIFAPRPFGPLVQVRASGGDVRSLTTLDNQQTHRFPHFLPDGRQFLFFAQGAPASSGVYLGSLDGTAPRRLVTADAAAVDVRGDWLLFVRDRALLAQRLDLQSGTVTGDPLTVEDSVALDVYRSASAVSTSASGLIAYRSGTATRLQLTWFDRTGREVGVLGGPDDNGLVAPRLSPDDRGALVFRTVQQNTDVWLVENNRTTRLTFDDAIDRRAVWSTDGRRIVFDSNRDGAIRLYEKPLDLSAEDRLLATPGVNSIAQDWSPRGDVVSFNSNDPKTLSDIWMLPFGGDRAPFAFLRTNADERDAMFSPNGRWVAYVSNASGRWEVYIRPFSGPGSERQVSTLGGIAPQWARDGSELFYIAPDGTLMAAPALDRERQILGRPVALFQTNIYGGGDLNVGRNYDVSRDGRFLINYSLDRGTPVTLLQNWTASRPN